MEFEETENYQPEEEKPAIYSKWAILGFSIFFSPVVGSILLMLNLRSIGKKKEGYLMLLFGVAFMAIAEIMLISIVGMPANSADAQKILTNHRILYYSEALDILGGGILAEYFFKRYFPVNDYPAKSIWRPLFIVLLAVMILSAMV